MHIFKLMVDSKQIIIATFLAIQNSNLDFKIKDDIKFRDDIKIYI